MLKKSSFFKRHAGVGIVEILIVVAIMLAVFAYGTTALTKMFKTTQLKNATQTLVNDLRDFQQRTMTEQKETTIIFFKGVGNNKQYQISFNGIPQPMKDLPGGVEVWGLINLTDASDPPAQGSGGAFEQIHFQPQGGVRGFVQEGQIQLRLTGSLQPVTIITVKPSGLVTFTFQ